MRSCIGKSLRARRGEWSDDSEYRARPGCLFLHITTAFAAPDKVNPEGCLDKRPRARPGFLPAPVAAPVHGDPDLIRLRSSRAEDRRSHGWVAVVGRLLLARVPGARQPCGSA